MHTIHGRRRRGALLVAACTAALATAASPASAATDTEAAQAERATKNRLIEQAKSKLTAFGNGLSLEPLSGTGVAPGQKVTARVAHVNQPSNRLEGKVFIDTAAAAGELSVAFGVTITPEDAVTGAALGPGQAVSTAVTGFSDRRSLLFRPPLFQSNQDAPDPLARAVDARVTMRVDLPPLEQLASSMASQLGLERPDTTQELVAFVFDHLTPPGSGRGDGLCRYLPPTHPAFCAVLPTVGDPDPLHNGLFERLKTVDVTPAETEKPHNLLTVLDVKPLPIPSVSAWFRHTNYAVSDRDARFCPDGFALIVVPPGTPGASAGPGFGELSDTLSDTRGQLAKLTPLLGMAALPGAIDKLVQTVNAYQGAGVRVWDQAAPNLNTNDFEMVGGGNCTIINDIEADREISSAIAFGLPGSQWKGFDQFDFGGSAFALKPDSLDWLVERTNLHNLAWGDRIRSLKLDVSADTQ